MDGNTDKKARLDNLIRRGHGHSLEAIRLEDDPHVRLRKLERFVVLTPPDTKSGKRARSLLEKLRTTLGEADG